MDIKVETSREEKSIFILKSKISGIQYFSLKAYYIRLKESIKDCIEVFMAYKTCSAL